MQVLYQLSYGPSVFQYYRPATYCVTDETGSAGPEVSQLKPPWQDVFYS